MAAFIYPNYPPDLNPEQRKHLLTSLNDWSIANGLAVRPSSNFVVENTDPSGVLAVTAPVTLFPSLFPKNSFNHAKTLQPAYNTLYAAISRDEEWLGEVIQELLEVDEFIAQLWELHLVVKKEGYVQDLSLGLFRSDYMIHVDPSVPASTPQIKQVEFNTIASSFGGLSRQVSLLHRHLLSTNCYPERPYLVPHHQQISSSIEQLAKGLSTAHLTYGNSKSSTPLSLCILFIVQCPERNIFDQRHIEYQLQTLGHTIFRLPFDLIQTHTAIPTSNPSRPLIYTPPHSPSIPYEVSTLYFRAGYSPDEYTHPAAWSARLHLERSAAIKCPSILTHLAGSKKVQQVLATPGSHHLERFLSDPDILDPVRRTFSAIYPLDDSPAGKEAKAIALDPERSKSYVLKPQREGGGNNIYRGNIPPFLKSLGDERKWRGYILMELIEPPAQRNSIIREGIVKTGEVICELGIYGTCLWSHSASGGDDGILYNSEAGYLLRTKGRESEEGGVAAGFGAVDSVLLMDMEGVETGN
ncbi:hypothetical protein MMC26_002301 [Xylographa opegraphella]|nr:hypothetical protein [Xylographa opegraphella]